MTAKRLGLLFAALLVPLFAGARAPEPAQETGDAAAGGRFVAVDVVVDAGRELLAAWQVEVSFDRARARLVGVEGGEHPTFARPPHYDPAALHRAGKVRLAAFDTGDVLPTGATRVARLHLYVEGPGTLALEARVEAAAGPDGAPFDAPVRLLR